MAKMDKFSKSFDEYHKVCGVSLAVCGQASPSYANKPSVVDWFTFGDKFNEVEIHPVVLFEMRKNKIRSR